VTRRATKAIRQTDRRHLVWQEPNVLFNFGPRSHLPRIGANSGLSFHDYCLNNSAPSCRDTEALVFDNAEDTAQGTDRALMLTEFGATNNHPRIEHIVDLADEHMVSWMWWAYCGCDDPTTSGPGDVQAIVKDPARPPRGANVIRRKLALLQRPYPQVIAGTPTAFGYDRDTDVFRLDYTARAPGGDIPSPRELTTVYVPRRHYPDGYAVHVSGADVVSAPGSQHLLLKRQRGMAKVRLKVRPRA